MISTELAFVEARSNMNSRHRSSLRVAAQVAYGADATASIPADGHARKILFAYNVCGLGGVETSIVNKLEALKPFGFEGAVLFQDYWGEGGKLMARYPEFFVCPDEKAQIEYIETFAPDVIVILDSPRFLRVVGKSEVSCPVLFETHMSDLEALKSRRIVEAIANSRVSMTVVPSKFNRDVLIDHSVDADGIRVIPNAIDFARFDSLSEDTEASSIDCTADRPMVLFVGRLEPQKNALEFIRLYGRLLGNDDSFRAIVLGAAVDTHDYEASVRSAAALVNGDVGFVPHLGYGEMPALYRAVAASGGCLVSTSLHESQPMIILEAMASGCPVVVSDVGGVREIVQQGISGHLYPLGDVEAAAKMIQKLRTDNHYRSGVVRAASEYVRSKHSFDHVAAAYREVLREVGIHDPTFL